MACDVKFVDRQDQLEWIVEPDWQHFRLNVAGIKSDIYKWLCESGTGTVVIYGCGRLPTKGFDPYRIWETYDEIYKHNYRIYFEDSDTAMMFKLRWGGAL